jgi:ribonuclease HI
MGYSSIRPPSTQYQCPISSANSPAKALELSKVKRVNIHTDSKYTFLILHAHAAIWKERGMPTATGSPTKYAQDILTLIDAVLLPRKLSVIHCPGHQTGESKIAKRNGAADEAAE